MTKLPMKFDLQFFAEGEGDGAGGGDYSINSMDALSELLGGIEKPEDLSSLSDDDGDDDDDDDDDDTSGAADDSDDAGDDDGDDDGQDGDDNDDDANDPEKKPDKKPDKKANPKDHQAFAAMRQANARSQRLINDIATALGIDTSDPEARDKALGEVALKGVAKKTNQDPETLRRLRALEENNANQQRVIATSHTRAQLGEIAHQFGADETRLREFVEGLAANGVDVVSQQHDLVRMYKAQYLEEIIEKQTAAAIEAARKTDDAAEHNSSKPRKRGKKAAPNVNNTIDSPAALRAHLDTIIPKHLQGTAKKRR